MARTKQSLRSRRNGEAKPEIERKLKEEYDRIKKLIKTRNQQMEQETTQSTPSTESDIDIENAQYVVCISTSFDTLQPGSKQAAGYGCVWVKYASLYTDSRDFRPWIHKGILCRRELGGYDIELKAIQSLLGYSSENCHITIISNSNRVYNFIEKVHSERSGHTLHKEQDEDILSLTQSIYSLISSKSIILSMISPHAEKNDFVKVMMRSASQLARIEKKEMRKGQTKITEKERRQQPQWQKQQHEKNKVSEQSQDEQQKEEDGGDVIDTVDYTGWTELEKEKPHIRSYETMQQWITDTFRHLH